MYTHAVPPPAVAVMADRDEPLYAGTNLTLICTVTFHDQVDFPTSITWTRNGQALSVLGNSRTITTTTAFNTTNVTALQFYPLKDREDGGLYGCSVVIDPTGQSPFVEQLNVTETMNLTVLGEWPSLCLLSKNLPILLHP